MTEQERFFPELSEDKPPEEGNTTDESTQTASPKEYDPLLPGAAAGPPINNEIKRTAPGEHEEQTPRRLTIVGRAIGSIAGRLLKRNRELPTTKQPIALGSTPAKNDASLVPEGVETDASLTAEDLVEEKIPHIKIEYKRAVGRIPLNPATGELPAWPTEQQVRNPNPMQTTTPPFQTYREDPTRLLEIVPDHSPQPAESNTPPLGVGQYWAASDQHVTEHAPLPTSPSEPAPAAEAEHRFLIAAGSKVVSKLAESKAPLDLIKRFRQKLDETLDEHEAETTPPPDNLLQKALSEMTQVIPRANARDTRDEPTYRSAKETPYRTPTPLDVNWPAPDQNPGSQ